jgi:thiamine-monophosphate kinase
VLVTGTLGASQAGLEVLQSGVKGLGPGLAKKHLRPEPRVSEGLLLASRFKLRGMIDVSDGLASELHHLARGSRVGLEIDQGALPIAPEALAAAARLKKDPLEYCLYGGEEYELLFTLPAGRAGEARELLRRRGMQCSVIGRAVKRSGVRMLKQDLSWIDIPDRGYKHRFQ